MLRSYTVAAATWQKEQSRQSGEGGWGVVLFDFEKSNMRWRGILSPVFEFWAASWSTVEP
jgi:hypothetical protein